MSLQLTVLTDNNVMMDAFYLGEPGFSCYIESDGARVLLDTGYSDVFLRNAKLLGIDLSALTHIVLSHGHNDHTRGLSHLIAAVDIGKMELVAHPRCLLPKRDGAEDTGAPIGIEEAKRLFGYSPHDGPYFITPRLCFLGEIPRKTDFEGRTPMDEVFLDGQWQPDMLTDDSALAYDTGEGVFVLTGCSHSGICNICEAAKAVFRTERIAGVLGGFHLRENNAQLARTAQYFAKEGVPMFYPCHCSTLEAKFELMKSLPVGEAGVGTRLEILK